MQLDEIVNEFLVESCENLDRIDRDLVTLEQAPNDSTVLAGIFRAVHTIKGTCGFLGFSRLESVTHVGENLLSKLRDGELKVTEQITSALLSLVDAIRSMLAAIENTGKDGDNDYLELVAILTELQCLRVEAAEAAAPASAPDVERKPGYINLDDIVIPSDDEPVVESSKATEAVKRAEVVAQPPAAAAKPTSSEAKAVSDTKTTASPSSAPPASAPKATADKGSNEAKSGENKAPSAAENNIRVDVSLLDKLMNLVGELVLARNQILQFSASIENTALVATTQRLNLITTELQEGVMKTRMQPIGNIWSKFPRVVRDLSVSCGKQVRVEMEGTETELDKTIIEAIKDPLTHIVRNSVDHGIEPPDVRVARGKQPEGRLFLRAYHESGQVIIEISDDGGGIDGNKIKAKALERRLLTQEQADRMGEREAISLIFLPGFSTAEKITNVSGRGVGMDVVKTNIERIGGLVDISSVVGQGSTIRIRIPLTLAIIPALMVSCAENRFAIPQISLLELLRLEPTEGRSQVEWINGAPMYRLRGNLLPLVSLGCELKLCTPEQAFGETINVVVLQADDHQFGLVIDEIQDTGEIVVKPLSKRLKSIPIYAGATILGDGQVALILDVMQLAQRANIVAENRTSSIGDVGSESKSKSTKTQSLLIFETSDSTGCAVPLSSLTRLEEIDRHRLEYSGSQMVVQYREQIMPLIDIGHAVGRGGYSDAPEGDSVHVLVYGREGKAIGLLVHRISDIVHEELKIMTESNRPGVAFTTVVQGKVIDVIDVCSLIQAVAPEYAESACAVL